MRNQAIFILALLMGSASSGAVAETSHSITISVDGHRFSGELDDSPVARQIYNMLPFRLSLTEMGGREKYGDLPDNVTAKGRYTDVYHPGDIGYWSPGNQMAFYYHNDGQRIPAPGIVTIGHFDTAGYPILADSKTRTLYVERANK